MTTRHLLPVETISFVTLAASLGVVLALAFHPQPKITSRFTLPALVSPLSSSITEDAYPTTQTFSQISPDGTKKLMMSVTYTPATTSKTFVFTTADADTTNQKQIYNTTLPTTENMSIPFNTWSPDDKF